MLASLGTTPHTCHHQPVTSAREGPISRQDYTMQEIQYQVIFRPVVWKNYYNLQHNIMSAILNCIHPCDPKHCVSKSLWLTKTWNLWNGFEVELPSPGEASWFQWFQYVSSPKSCLIIFHHISDRQRIGIWIPQTNSKQRRMVHDGTPQSRVITKPTKQKNLELGSDHSMARSISAKERLSQRSSGGFGRYVKSTVLGRSRSLGPWWNWSVRTPEWMT